MVDKTHPFVVGLKRVDNTQALSGLARSTTDGDINKLANEINRFIHSVSADLPP